MKKYTQLLLFWIFPMLVWTQKASISGVISTQETVLPFANVILEAQELGVTTDEAGKYELNDLDAGDYILVVSYVGYISLKKKIHLEADEQLVLDLEMTSNTALQEVVVTGTMKPTFIAASPIKVEVVTAKQMNTYLPAASSSIVEGIQLVNGVQEVVACGVCYTNSISINGLEGAYTAVLIDGTPVYGNLAAVYGLNGIPNMIVDRFEVIKGPSSTLYGSEAVAGVINIITKNPEEQPLLEIDIMGTTHRESFGNIAVAPVIGNSSGYIGLNYAYINDFEDENGDDFGDNINLDRYSLFSKWKIGRKSGKLFSMAGKYYYEDRRNGVEAFLKDRTYRDLRGDDEIYGESIYTNRAELFGTYEFNTSTNLKMDFSFSNHLQDSYYGSDYYEAKQQIAFANLLWNLPSEKHDVLLGLTNRLQRYDDNTVATETQLANGTIENTPDNQYIPGIFFQDEFEASPQWTILGGARLDHYQSHGLIFSPRLNLKYKPSDWTTLRANFGTGFRVVNLFTEDHAFITGQRSVEIQEALKPEQSYNSSLNLNHVFTLGTGSGTIDLEGYYTYFTNKINPDYDTPGKIIYANSKGFAQTMGIGTTINYNFRFPLGLQAGFNLQSVTETEDDEAGQRTTRNVEFAPKWTGVFLANYRWKKAKTTFAYTARLTGPMALPEVFDVGQNGELLSVARPTISRPFSLHNIQATMEVNQNWSWYVGIQNLLNYRQDISPLIGYNDPNANLGFSEYFDTSYAYAPNQGRELYLGIKWLLSRSSSIPKKSY
ncbi:MAG: TonB-dependent receptor [Bacteroidota bacterium]